MSSNEIREKFREFFKSKGHALLPSASLVPENDPTVLFTTAGMHPLVPYLLGQGHPSGKRLANVQKCVRVQDIDEVGDNRHDTFFEMLGNWSLGDYFKKEAIEWSFEFFSSKEWLGLDPKRVCVTVFEGDSDAPRDDESIGHWQRMFESVGIKAEVATSLDAKGDGYRIFAYPKRKNWWPPQGTPGPCGPDTEMFYDMLPGGVGKAGHFQESDEAQYGPYCHPNCDCGRFIEFWNDVFMEFHKLEDGSYVPLKQKNVDTGMGLERVAMIIQGKQDIFETDLFSPLMDVITTRAKKLDVRSARIIADHVRTAIFMIVDGVLPSNVERGYILRRIIRRAVLSARQVELEFDTKEYVDVVAKIYNEEYPEVTRENIRIMETIRAEVDKFEKTLVRGLKEYERVESQSALTGIVSGAHASTLFFTHGFPLEMTIELAAKKNIKVDESGFWKEFEKHQELSRTATAGTFKGGLQDHSEQTTRLHTATHLLHATLRKVLGDHVLQKGSNITAERLRFDFSHPQKMTTEEIKKVEDMINDVVKRDLPVSWKEMTFDEAKAAGALGLFESKYGEKVKVYSIGDYSKEVCGGPHVNHTAEVGAFKITKEEAVAQGIRRIKAVVK